MSEIMQITIEISMYPLRDRYEDAILEFIQEIKSNPGIEIRVNETSTHIFGDYDKVFNAINGGVKKSFLKYGKAVFVLKILNGNLKIIDS